MRKSPARVEDVVDDEHIDAFQVEAQQIEKHHWEIVGNVLGKQYKTMECHYKTFGIIIIKPMREPFETRPIQIIMIIINLIIIIVIIRITILLLFRDYFYTTEDWFPMRGTSRHR